MTGPSGDSTGAQAALPLFVYGSLRDPDLRTFLFGERADLATRPANLPRFSRHHSAAIGYPYIVPDPSSRVEGELLLGLGAGDYAILDAYEDVEDGLYERVAVTVETPEGPVSAWTYARGPKAP